jgi:hypothetical protein
MAKKQKLSECCKAPMIGGVQCENCGSDGKFTPGTAIIKRLDGIINLIRPGERAKETTGERFIEEDGFIKDTKTKLMWDKNGSQERLTYAKAEEFVAELNKEQYPDWRIPTREELESILDLTRRNPAINPLFKCESSGYWSSTPCTGYTGYAWYVFFGDGDVYGDDKTFSGFVRPVRQYF